LGWYLANVIGMNILPNDPVPPVIRIDELDNIIGSQNKG
jgi:hypothetical protein